MRDDRAAGRTVGFLAPQAGLVIAVVRNSILAGPARIIVRPVNRQLHGGVPTHRPWGARGRHRTLRTVRCSKDHLVYPCTSDGGEGLGAATRGVCSVSPWGASPEFVGGDAQARRGRTRPEGSASRAGVTAGGGPGKGKIEGPRLRSLGPDAGSGRGCRRSARRRPNHDISLRTEERRLMPPLATMNPFTCNSACEAAPEPDPAIRANDPTEAAAPARPNKQRREAVASADEDTPWRRAHPAPVDEVLGGAALDPPGLAYRARVAGLAAHAQARRPRPSAQIFWAQGGVVSICAGPTFATPAWVGAYELAPC